MKNNYYELNKGEIKDYKSKFLKLDYTKRKKRDQGCCLLCLGGSLILMLYAVLLEIRFSQSLTLVAVETIFTTLIIIFLVLFLYTTLEMNNAFQKWLKVKHNIEF